MTLVERVARLEEQVIGLTRTAEDNFDTLISATTELKEAWMKVNPNGALNRLVAKTDAILEEVKDRQTTRARAAKFGWLLAGGLITLAGLIVAARFGVTPR